MGSQLFWVSFASVMAPRQFFSLGIILISHARTASNFHAENHPLARHLCISRCGCAFKSNCLVRNCLAAPPLGTQTGLFPIDTHLSSRSFIIFDEYCCPNSLGYTGIYLDSLCLLTSFYTTILSILHHHPYRSVSAKSALLSLT